MHLLAEKMSSNSAKPPSRFRSSVLNLLVDGEIEQCERWCTKREDCEFA